MPEGKEKEEKREKQHEGEEEARHRQEEGEKEEKAGRGESGQRATAHIFTGRLTGLHSSGAPMNYFFFLSPPVR